MYPISPHGLSTGTMSGDHPLDHPLPALFIRALHYASKSTRIPAVDPACQATLQNAFSDLSEISSKVSSLGMFREHESIDDLTTTDAAYLLVDFVRAEVVGRLQAQEKADRVLNLNEANTLLRAFVGRLHPYGIIPADDKELFSNEAGSDPGSRRDLKIKQNDAEKALRLKIETLLPDFAPSSDFDLYASLQRPPPNATVNSLRELTFLLLRLAHLQAQTQLCSIGDELELLKNAPLSLAS